ncbi:MAG: T9SS type A sorting domain-containing protein [Reichenbachiella sp.]
MRLVLASGLIGLLHQPVFGQSGPGGIGSPTSNIFWIRSDKGITQDGSSNVTTIFDQANSNDATNNNTTTNPSFDGSAGVGSNSEPGILFTSLNSEYLNMSDDANINTGGFTARSFYLVFQTGTDVSTLQYIYQQGGAADGLFAYISGGVLTVGINSSSASYTISSAALSINTEYIAAFVYDGGTQTIDLSLDGTASTQVTSVAASVGAHTNIRVGSDVSNANFFNGHLAELAYYNIALNAGQLRVLGNYFAKKFGITVINDHYGTPGADYRYNLIGISRVSTEEHNASTGLGGTMYVSENGSDAMSDNEHIFIGHNNSNLSTTSTDLIGVSNTERYNRVWYIQKTGVLGAIIELDIVESGLYASVSGLTATDFSLLRRAGISGDFSQVSMVTNPIFNGNRIQFTLTNAELISGYFTLGSPSEAKKWYVINSGNWSDANTWTLDPAGSIFNNPDGLTPDTSPTAASDEVTVLSGKTVTVGNGDLSGTLTKLTLNGTLDFGSSTGHGTVTLLEGSGTIKLSGDVLPTFTDASNFTNAGPGAGTVEYYGSGDVDLTSSSGLTTFYNLVLNFDASTNHLITTTNFTVNGDLTITQGDLQINDNSATTRLIIDLLGNLAISANGEISVGTGNIGTPTAPSNFHTTFHRVNLSGNLTNNGTVNFSNLTGYDFDSFPVNGDAVTVSFIGQTNNTLICNSTTNFYDFMIDKGTGQTYMLTVNSSAVENFRVYGRNDVATEHDLDNPVLGKTIYIKNGTLHLTGSIFIPSLTEGKIDIATGMNHATENGSWIVPNNGRLWIDGANVTVWNTAESAAAIAAIDSGLTAGDIDGVDTGEGNNQMALVIGAFQLTDGAFHTRNALGLHYSENGKSTFLIEGGTLDISQFRRIGGSNNANPVYQQTGGTVTVHGESLNVDGIVNGGRTNNGASGIFDFIASDGVFIMSGGTILIQDYNDAANGATTNGLNINVPDGNYNVTGGTIEIDTNAGVLTTDGFEISFTPNFYNLTITDDDDDFVVFESDLTVSNDLILANGTDTRMNGNNLTVGRNFNIVSGAIYTQGGNNTTSFNGEADQTITLAGTYGDFYNVTFSDVGIKTLSTGNLTSTNMLTIESGATVDDGGQTIFIEGTISNSGTHQSSTGGEIEFSGGAGTYTISGNGAGVFGNINLNDATNDVSFSANQAVTGTITFNADQLIDINTYKLRMQESSAGFSGISANRFVITAGNASDLGLEMYVDATDATETITFPIGTDANADIRYTPVVAVLSNITTSDDGYIAISVADEVLATTDGTGGTVLSYYWHVEHSGFTALPNVTSYTFSGSENDDGTGSTASFPNSWRGGKVLSSTPFTRTGEDNTSINNPSGHDINMDGDGTPFTLENADYSAGQTNRFNGTPDVYYTRQSGNFNTASTWSRNDATGAGTQEVPVAGSVVIIQSDGVGNEHRVNVFAAINDLGIVQFDHDYVNSPVPERENIPRLQFWIAGTFELGVVSGTGMISFDASDNPTVNGDFGDFGTSTDSYYLYFNGPATLATIPTPIPNLMMESATYTINQAITTNGDLEITGGGTAIPNQNIEIKGDMVIGSWAGGFFQFPNSGSAITVTIDGNIDFTQDPNSNLQDRDLIVADAAIDLEHTLILKGNILHGGENGHAIDLYNASATRPRAVLELQGTGTHNYSRTSTSTPDLYRIVLNKGTDQTSTFTFNDDFTLSTPTATYQPITLQNGTLIINDATIGDANDIVLTNATNNTDFDISSTTGLQISAGTLTVLGDDIGISLDGKITLDGSGILDMDGGNNNYIQYSSSGLATIEISGTAQLLVGSQIRESSVTSGGILSYTQSGGTVVIGTSTGGSPEADKPMLQVSNTGSLFSFIGGTITLSNHLAGVSTPSLLLAPASSNVGVGTTIQFGDASTVSGSNALTVQSTISLQDIIVDNSAGPGNYPTLTLLNEVLNISNDLTIETNSTFDASGLALNISGDLTNNGTFIANGNVTTFNGSDTQIITGNGTTFYDLTKSGSNTVQLTSGTAINVSNDFNITSGTFDDNNNNITVTNTVNNTATHTNSNVTKTNKGIILAGSSVQSITGAGTFSRIEINNSAGVMTNASITVTEQIGLNAGSLDIQGFQLNMGENAVFLDVSGGGFSSSKMVQTRRSFTDAGVIKTFNGTSASPFTYPIGSGDKYTPVLVTLTQNSQTAATIAVRAADEPHPNVQEDVDIPEFVDQDNALQYYWEVTSNGMTDFLGNITYTYEGSDAYVTSPFTLDDYEIARLLPDNSDNWNKLETGFSYQARDGSNTLSFDINSAANDTEIGGDYTAGIDGAIPDQVQTVTSTVSPSGNWSNDASWDATAPKGAVVHIVSGDEITMDVDNLLAYRTIIDGTLIVAPTANQRLGRVTGTGTLEVQGNGNLPAGIYDDFFNCSTGGTLAFNDNDNYTLPNEIANLRNLLIKGTGTKSFPNTDITICNNLELQDGTTLNNDFNVNVTVLGDMTLTNGTYNLGNNSNVTVNGNVTVSAGSLNLLNNNLTILGSLTVNGGTLALGTNGTIDLDGDLILNGTGTISGANSANLNFGGDLTYSAGTLSVGATTTTFTADGIGTQTVSGIFTGGSSFNNLIINKPSGNVTIIDGGNDVEIDGTLTLTSGHIITDASNSLTITSTGTISGGSSGSYIQGPVTKNDLSASANFTFPIGDASRFAYSRLESVVNGGRNWTAEYTGSNPDIGDPIDPTTNSGFGVMVEISGNYWTISPSSLPSQATLELGVVSGMGVVDINDARIAQNSSSTWVNMGGSPSGTSSNGSLTSQVVIDFSNSIFSFGGINNSALPVDLTSFEGKIEEKDVLLTWSTASELSNDYFELERSVDGNTFEVIAKIDGHGTTNAFTNYSHLDKKPYLGVSYYRLVQVDFDGMQTIYQPIAIDNNQFREGIEVSVFPNPTNSNNINIRLLSGDPNSMIQLAIHDLSGNLVHAQQIQTFLGSSDQKININRVLESGIYLISISQANNRQIQRLIIK